MKYRVLYDTLINKIHVPKDAEIEFEAGTDEGYIKRLLANKVIAPLEANTDSKTHSKLKDSKKNDKKPNEAQKDIQRQS